MVTCTAARACWVANASLPLELIAIDLVQQRPFLVGRDTLPVFVFFCDVYVHEKTVAVRERRGDCFHT